MNLICFSWLAILLKVIYVAETYIVKHPVLEERNRFKRNYVFSDYDQCVTGTYQTPIHVENNMFEYITMPAIDFIGYNNYLPSPIILENTGRTVKLTAGQYLDGGLYPYPSITGGLLNGFYTWDSLHFHWGRRNDRGSEHMVNNVRYPMEMHIVHRRSNYKTRDEALEAKDGLAVLAFFFELQVADNRRLRPIVRKLKKVRLAGQTTNVTQTFSLNTILPRNTDFFFTYEGSLSSPPCSESVFWMIFPTPIKISFRQMEEFRTIEVPENFRSLQPLGQRKIFLRETKRFRQHGFQEFSRKNVSSTLFWLKLR